MLFDSRVQDLDQLVKAFNLVGDHKHPSEMKYHTAADTRYDLNDDLGPVIAIAAWFPKLFADAFYAAPGDVHTDTMPNLAREPDITYEQF